MKEKAPVVKQLYRLSIEPRVVDQLAKLAERLREPRVAGIDIDEGVQFRVLRFDARQKRLNDVDRRQPARRDLRREAMGRQETRIGVG